MADADVLNPADWAVLRLYIDVGAARFAEFKKSGVWPTNVDYPTNAQLVKTVAARIPSADFELTAEEAQVQAAYDAKHGDPSYLAPALRRPEVMFRNRAQLVEVADALAPTTAAIAAKVPGYETAGPEWWAVALAAGGALYWIGRLNWKGALVAAIAARVLFALSAYLAYTVKTEDGRTIVQQVKDALAEAAAAAGRGVERAANMALVVLGLVGVVATLAFSRKTSPGASTSASTSAEVDPPPGELHTGALPREAADLLERVYEQKIDQGYTKARAAKQAWGAVKRAGYERLEAADGGAWWFKRGTQADLLTRTLLQLEAKTGTPADEGIDVWSRAAGVDRDRLQDALGGDLELEAVEVAALREAAFDLAGMKPPAATSQARELAALWDRLGAASPPYDWSDWSAESRVSAAALERAVEYGTPLEAAAYRRARSAALRMIGQAAA